MLDGPEQDYAPAKAPARRSPAAEGRLPRDYSEDFAPAGDAERPVRRSAAPSDGRARIKLTLRGRLLATLWGRIGTGLALLAVTGVMIWLLMVTRTFLLHDARFRIASPAAIELEGNRHLTRPQLLAVFADDIERNIFRLSLDERRAQLEAMPWVEHATVMRLLPGRVRVALVERTPVAFVRQGGHIGLVDAHGVLLDMGAGAHYSFPVVTGIAESDPLSTRAARMKIFTQFVTDLDSMGEKNSDALSEVDLSNPEDVKALVEEHSSAVLVHFGDDHFLDRFRKVKELLPQWHAQYPNLASADMRYEHEIPLAMAAAAPAPAAIKLVAPAPRPAAARPVPPKPVKAHPTAAAVAHPHAVHPVVPAHEAAWAPLKAPAHIPASHAALPHPLATLPTPETGFIQPVVAKPWQPPAHAVTLPATPAKPSAPGTVSASARASFPAHGAPGKKPAAGKPLSQTIPHPSDQAAPR